MDELTKEIIDLRSYYRATFGSMQGMFVLNDMLIRSGFYQEINPLNLEEVGLVHKRNLMLEVLKILGSYSDNPQTVTESITNALINQPIYTERTEE